MHIKEFWTPHTCFIYDKSSYYWPKKFWFKKWENEHEKDQDSWLIIYEGKTGVFHPSFLFEDKESCMKKCIELNEGLQV
jgi:hypothetical protein